MLRGYVKHLLYALEFDATPQLIEKDTIFVPAAWDSIEKIQIDFSSQSLTNDEGAPARLLLPPLFFFIIFFILPDRSTSG